jgi:hypothetical protein
VNLDGLINGYAYQEALHRGQLRRFFAASGVTHIAVSGTLYRRGAYYLSLPARLYRENGAAVIGLESAEVYRSGRTFHGRRFVIWELARLPVFEDGRDPRALAYCAP